MAFLEELHLRVLETEDQLLEIPATDEYKTLPPDYYRSDGEADSSLCAERELKRSDRSHQIAEPMAERALCFAKRQIL